MPVLDKQRHSLLLKNTKTGKFDEIDNVKKIKDRSFIRARPRDGGSGIPMPGMKKAVTKSSGNSDNKKNNRTGLVQNSNRNNNGSGSEGKAKKPNCTAKPGFGAKNPNRITSPERSATAPRTSTPISTANKPNGNLSSFGYSGKPKPTPKIAPTPVVATQSPKSSRDANNNTNMDDAAQLHSSGSPVPDNQPPSGNGLGGGSVSKTGFSYHHGTGVPAFRKSESPSGSLKSSGNEVGQSAAVDEGPSDKTPQVGSPTQKNKLQPLGAPLKGDIRKSPPNNTGKRSIPAPKGKLYGSLIPSSKLKSSIGIGNSTVPPCGDPGNGLTDNHHSKMSTAAPTHGNTTGLKPAKANAPPPPPSRSKTPVIGRTAGGAPPPIAPKPTGARLAAAHTPALTAGEKLSDKVLPSNKLPCKDMPRNEMMADDDFPPELSAFSNIKRPESPEPRATINGRGSSRSLRKQTLKPVSIPQVPALEGIRRQISDEVSKSEIDIRQPEAKSVVVHNEQNLAKESSQSAPDLIPTKSWASALENAFQAQTGGVTSEVSDPTQNTSPTMGHAVLSPAKQEDKKVSSVGDCNKASSENTTSLKRGLSSLKRFIPGRSSAKQSKSQLNKSTEELVTKPTAGPELDVTRKTEIVEVDVHRSDEPAETTARMSSVHEIASKFEGEKACMEESPASSQQHNSTLKKPTLPTTDLVSTLVKTGNDASRENGRFGDANEVAEPAKNANPESSQSVISQINQRLNPSNMTRKSNLVKTGSYNSVNSSDSATSNTTNSSVSQQRQPSIQKKVSFQDNVMVSDGRGANTYVQRLKSKGDDSNSTSLTPALKSRTSAAEQLGIVATEADIKQFLDNHAVTSPVDAHPHDPDRVMSPVSVGERKSAVEAAIETITGKPSSRKVTINDSYRAATQRPLTPSYQLAQMAEAMQPMTTAPDDEGAYYTYGVPGFKQSQSQYNEMWHPSYGNMPPQTYEQYPAPMRSMTPNPGSPYGQYPAAIVALDPSPTVAYSSVPSSENAVNFRSESRMAQKRDTQSTPTQADPYFQTQSGFPYGEDAADDNRWNVDTPPYYEGCGSWKRGQSASAKVEPQQKPIVDLSCAKGASSGANDGEDDDLTINHKDGRAVPVARPADKMTQERVKAMERQIANLTGMVETIITHTDKEVEPSVGDKDSTRMPAQSLPQDTGATSSDNDAISLSEVRGQMLKLRSTAQDLKKQLEDIKRQQRTNLERMSDMIVSRSRELTSLIATTAGSEHAPVRARRLTLDRERSSYGDNASRTERQLTDVEAAVEELRNEVVERRCRVNTREVEALALQLSQAGRTIANLKSSFPSLCDEMRTVGSAETEVIIQEEKFMDTEPTRLDEQLKRCKQLTQTLFTLKKLATVQEARSKTPVNILGSQGMMGTRPETPSLYLASLMSYGSPATRGSCRGATEAEEIKRSKGRILSDVRSMRVDSQRRMQSLQEAEQRWTRRVKYIRQYDSRKMEKALELAEKALRKTNNVRSIEERRKNHFDSMFATGGIDQPRSEDKLSASLSESSSVDSLSPPPPPMTNITSPSSQPEVPHYASSACSMSTASSVAHQPQSSLVSPDGGYISSEILSPQQTNPNYMQNMNYEHPYQQPQAQSAVYPVQQDSRSTASKHYQFRSNSLQRSRSQRVQQVQHFDEYQRQRSRTPNPFSPSTPYETEYVVQYDQQYAYQQTYQDPYAQQEAYYGAQAQYQPSPQQGQYGAQSQFAQYNPPTAPQPNYHTPQDSTENNGQSHPMKYASRQLRKPTSFTSKLPSSSATQKDPSPPRRSSPPSSGVGGPADGANRRRGAAKPLQQQGENTQRVKEQYSKLQQMQRKQMFIGKKPPKPQPGRTQMMSPPMINPSAKSSDV